jgi:hypothetical protein
MAHKKPSKAKNYHKRVPFRDLDKDGVTYSFLAKFLMDREQARLQYVEGLDRAGTIDALDFGNCFHELLQYRCEGGSMERAALRNRLGRWLSDQKKFRKLSLPEFNQIKYLSDQVLMIFPYYVQYWERKKEEEYIGDFVCQEEDFKVVHQVPWNGSTREVLLRGRFDAIFRLKGRLWLMENKTKSMIDEEGLQASLSQDLQTMMYCQAIRLVYGETPAGVLYNVIKRPGHRLGKEEKYGDCIGRMEKAIKEDPDKYFIRYHVTFDEKDLDKWVSRTLNPLLKQVRMWWDEISVKPFDPWSIPDRVHHFINPEGLYTRYGRSEYFEYLTRGSLHGLRRREK